MQSTTPTTTTSPVPPPNDNIATKAAPVMNNNNENNDNMPPDEKKESPSSDGYLVDQQPPMHPAGIPMPITMNGNSNNLPPQQVYVNGNHHNAMMNGLENQFHSLGMTEGHAEDSHTLDLEEEDNDGEEGGGEDDPVKLFVGQVRNRRMMMIASL
jgi:hypothetical protein